MRYVLAIDQGTTGTTVLVLDENLIQCGRSSREFRQIFPQPGWVEHDPADIWTSVVDAVAEAVATAGIAPSAIAAIGITNQRETTLLWERSSVQPVHNAIVWQDRRTADTCAALKASGTEPLLRERTGLVLDPYFSATKLQWLLARDEVHRRRASTGELAFGTIDSYLVARLTGGRVHITDVTNASRTLLFGLETLDWDDELLELFDVPREVLPQVKSSAEVYGETSGVPGLPDGIPIAGIAGDQQAALFGQACFDTGAAKCTYGTGAFILMNSGPRPVVSQSGLLSTVAWRLGSGDERGEVAYALEGSAFIAGAAVQWLRDGLGIIAKASEVESLAKTVADSGGVVVVPGFAGLGAPHWRPEARGLISGITRGTTAAHIARATLEGIALQNYDILRAMEMDASTELTTLRVDGGAAMNDLLMQFQADILGVDILRPRIVETTALGAAFLAGLSVGMWRSKRAIAEAWQEERRFVPNVSEEVSEHLLRWQASITKA